MFFPLGKKPHEFALVKEFILKDSCPLSTSNSTNPFFENEIFPLINLVNFFFLIKTFFSLALKGFSFFMFKHVDRKGKIKNLKHAAEEIGFPGNPKNAVFLFLNFENKIGLPGLIATPLKELASLKFLIIPETKSNLPAETAPDVMIIFVLDFKCFFISFLKIF